MKNSPKLAILQSLDSMDAIQMEEVLKYIKDLMQQPVPVDKHELFKRQAMEEIRQALNSGKSGLPVAA